MLAGAKKAGGDYGLEVGLFGPTSETDVNQQVQLVENSISRGVDAIVVAPNSSDALNNVIERARDGGTKVIVADTAVTTESEGFIGTDNVKAAEQAGERLCELAKDAGNETGDVMIASSVAGVQVLKDREAGLPHGPEDVPEPQGLARPVQQQRPQHRGQPGQRRADRQPEPGRHLRRQQHLGQRRRPRDQGQRRGRQHPGRSPSTPTRRRTRRWPTARSTGWSSRTRTSSATRA